MPTTSSSLHAAHSPLLTAFDRFASSVTRWAGSRLGLPLRSARHRGSIDDEGTPALPSGGAAASQYSGLRIRRHGVSRQHEFGNLVEPHARGLARADVRRRRSVGQGTARSGGSGPALQGGAKAARHTLDDSTPAHDFATLLNELATIVRNTCHTPNAARAPARGGRSSPSASPTRLRSRLCRSAAIYLLSPQNCSAEVPPAEE